MENFIDLRQISDLMICLNQKQHDEMLGTILKTIIRIIFRYLSHK
jgi:hypothetical protein